MTDFGFARIAARNEDEMRRMSYCGTGEQSRISRTTAPELINFPFADGYMVHPRLATLVLFFLTIVAISSQSPEILTGAEFDLPTDVFSLGIIVSLSL